MYTRVVSLLCNRSNLHFLFNLDKKYNENIERFNLNKPPSEVNGYIISKFKI